MQAIQYSVDLALCVDATGSMAPIISEVKKNALQFYERLQKVMSDKGKAIDSLRVRLIAFRDYYVPGEEAMKASAFFSLPEQQEAFSRFVHSINADGGGDEPENGLEALALAIQSDWAKTGDRRRQIIVMWTDTYAHPLDKNADKKPSSYPTDLPKNFDELTDLWEGQGPMSGTAKRFVIYAPDAEPWSDISNHWNNTIHFPSRAGQGLSDVDFQSILDAIANSV